MNAKATGNLFLNPSIAFPIDSLIALNFSPSHAPSCPAFSFTVSQFFQSRTPIAIIPPIATIAKPIGLIRKANAAPRAPVTPAPIVAATFHTACAAARAYV